MTRKRRKKSAGQGYPAMRTGNIRAEVFSDEVENPYFAKDHAESPSNPKTVAVFKNARESAVETLYARGGLDKAQKRAADRFRALWEAMGGAGAGAMDYTREPVDGGGGKDPITDRQIDAGRRLLICRNLLGARMYDLVCKVCGEGLALKEVHSEKRAQLTAADNLRSSLNDLAELWGMKTDPDFQRKAG